MSSPPQHPNGSYCAVVSDTASATGGMVSAGWQESGDRKATG